MAGADRSYRRARSEILYGELKKRAGNLIARICEARFLSFLLSRPRRIRIASEFFTSHIFGEKFRHLSLSVRQLSRVHSTFYTGLRDIGKEHNSSNKLLSSMKDDGEDKWKDNSSLTA